ncbi:Uncharacterized protein dnm_024690 [Desulfonema magnum]|uniref:Uncharacterized protein n=1 Tax=Desulfonema magnum TaxID=45655 RepID=A0A975GMA3_9BACT|nr:Uncharacterized protein dnm_024690 [Desulfonema magnum]
MQKQSETFFCTPEEIFVLLNLGNLQRLKTCGKKERCGSFFNPEI